MVTDSDILCLPLFEACTARSLNIRAQDLVDSRMAGRIFHALHRTPRL